MPKNINSKHELLNEWFPVKEAKHNSDMKKIPKVTDGEVWWVAVGENVGVEINGKSEYFSRPAVVFKKLSHLGFMGIPLSTQNHNGSWYVQFRFQGKDVCAVLSQVRVFSTARLYNRLGQLDEKDLTKVKEAFLKLYFGEKISPNHKD